MCIYIFSLGSFDAELSSERHWVTLGRIAHSQLVHTRLKRKSPKQCKRLAHNSTHNTRDCVHAGAKRLVIKKKSFNKDYEENSSEFFSHGIHCPSRKFRCENNVTTFAYHQFGNTYHQFGSTYHQFGSACTPVLLSASLSNCQTSRSLRHSSGRLFKNS